MICVGNMIEISFQSKRCGMKIDRHGPIMIEILDEIAQVTGISHDDLIAKDRQRKYAWPRQAFMWHAKQAGRSLTQIGAFLSNRDHTTIIHGIRSFEERYKAGRVDKWGRQV